MTESEVTAALLALRAALPTAQQDDEVSTAEAALILGMPNARTVERALEQAGWASRIAVLHNGKRGRVWREAK